MTYVPQILGIQNHRFLYPVSLYRVSRTMKLLLLSHHLNIPQTFENTPLKFAGISMTVRELIISIIGTTESECDSTY